MAATIDVQTGRRRVLDAAATLFVAQGYSGTTLRQIAAQAGIKAGSIYHHFDSKDDLFVAVLADGISVMLAAFDEVAAVLDDDASLEDRVLAHVRAHLSAVFENGPYTTVHVTAFFSAPIDIRARVVPERDRYEQRWQDLFEGLFRDLGGPALRLHRLLLFGAMNSTTEWFDPAGSLSLDQLASSIADHFLNGVTP